jgi:hypothetical protein
VSRRYLVAAGSARSKSRKPHPKPRRRLPPAEGSEPLAGGDWSPFTPMGMVEGYGRFARGVKRSIQDGQFSGRSAWPLIVLIASPLLLLVAIAIFISTV